MTLPKLHIRDLFWLVLVVAMGCAWWVEHKRARVQRLRTENAEAELRLRSLELEAANAVIHPLQASELRRLRAMLQATQIEVARSRAEVE